MAKRFSLVLIDCIVSSDNSKNSEISIDNIKIDKLTNEYLIEIKKSDADVDACKWQLLYYLKVLKDKGIDRKGKLEFVEKNKGAGKVLYFELNDEVLMQLDKYIDEIECLLQ